jgi:hypothetical protein
MALDNLDLACHVGTVVKAAVHHDRGQNADEDEDREDLNQGKTAVIVTP